MALGYYADLLVNLGETGIVGGLLVIYYFFGDCFGSVASLGSLVGINVFFY